MLFPVIILNGELLIIFCCFFCLKTVAIFNVVSSIFKHLVLITSLSQLISCLEVLLHCLQTLTFLLLR